MRPLVSVIIPTFNRSQFVIHAVGSVLRQTCPDLEIIVIDDGSTDDTRLALAPLMDQIQYFYQPNSGVSVARNNGIGMARGEWIAFLDSDDEWAEQKLAVQLSAVEKHPELQLHATNATLASPNGSSVMLFDLNGLARDYPDLELVERPLPFQIRYGLARPPCLLVRRRALLAAAEGGEFFDPRLTIYEDQDLLCRLALQGPWGVSHQELVRVYRREEPALNLSRQRGLYPVRAASALVYLYGKLRRSPGLTLEEQALVLQTQLGARAELGMEYLKRHKLGEARRQFSHSLRDAFSLKALLRYLATFIPGPLCAALVRRWEQYRWGARGPSLKPAKTALGPE